MFIYRGSIHCFSFDETFMSISIDDSDDKYFTNCLLIFNWSILNHQFFSCYHKQKIIQKFRMASRRRFLERSITNVSFHNRLTEEDAMWRRRENERDGQHNDNKQRHRSRSPYEKRKKSSRKSDESKTIDNNNKIEADFGPPLPTNLGVNADRWDHAFFMQRYPKDYEKQMNESKRKQSSSSDDERQKKKQHRHENKKKSKRKHRSRS
jgi:hypothetical protein